LFTVTTVEIPPPPVIGYRSILKQGTNV
jgi:hypothetical protein